MPKKNGRLGGFTAQNSGKIENCYSVVRMDTKGLTAGGFVGENMGVISKSYSYCKLKKLTGGFSGDGGGDTEQSCYFFHDENKDSKNRSRQIMQRGRGHPQKGATLMGIKSQQRRNKLRGLFFFV
ncbi:MAG: hypothetical protein RSD33_10760 [Clostridium sp.]